MIFTEEPPSADIFHRDELDGEISEGAVLSVKKKSWKTAANGTVLRIGKLT